MEAILGVVKEKRKAYVKLLNHPVGKQLSNCDAKQTQLNVKQMGFQLPSFSKDPLLGPVQNTRLSKECFAELHDAVHTCWSLDKLQREVRLHPHIERMDVCEFEEITGVHISLERKPVANPYNVSYKFAYVLGCKLVDPEKPLGKIIGQIQQEKQAQKEALDARKLIQVKAVNQLNEAIIAALPDLVEGGLRSMQMPLLHFDGETQTKFLSDY